MLALGPNPRSLIVRTADTINGGNGSESTSTVSPKVLAKACIEATENRDK